MRTFAGIDPGADGALCIINAEGLVLDCIDRAEGARLWLDTLQLHKPTVTALEKVGARRGNAAGSMFAFGEQVGWIRCILEMVNIIPVEPRPQEWQAAVLNGFSPDPKTNSYRNAVHLFPSGSWAGPRGGIKHGRTDAYHMARFALHTWRNQR
jgi:hypothetical protein